jgi:hypothetical protein
MQHISQDNLLHNIIPFIGYFDLGDFLVSLCYRSNAIESIKSKEYYRRLTCIDNPNKYISKIYTIDGLRIKDLRVISHERGESLIWDCVILHRYDGPTVIWANGCIDWYFNGKLHREGDEPAVIDSDGTQYWIKHGLQHRDGGPAKIQTNGYQAWAQYGETHREDGPAIIWDDGKEDWVMRGEYVKYPGRNYKTIYILDGLTVEMYIRPGYYENDNKIFAHILIPKRPSINYFGDMPNADIKYLNITSIKFKNISKEPYSGLEICYLDKENEQTLTLDEIRINHYDNLRAYYKKLNTV